MRRGRGLSVNKEVLQKIELELAVMVRRLTSITTERGNNLDRSAYLLLQQLSVQGACGVKALAGQYQLDPSTVSRQAAALEMKGYVYKTADPSDGRSYFYQITEQGAEELSKYRRIRLEKIAKRLDGWTDEDCANFAKLLEKFNVTLQE